MTADDHRIWRERLGAHVLGQLSESERAATEAHLEGCPDCRAEVEALSPMAGLLQRADPERLSPSPAPPADLGDRIARRIAAERRASRRRRLRIGFGVGAAAAAATAALLIALVFTGSQSEAPTPTTQTIAFRDLPKGVAAGAQLEPRPWGSDVRVWVRGVRPGTLCTVWLRGSDGTKVPAGSFRYVYAGEGEVPQLTSGLDPPEVKAIGIDAGAKTFVAPINAHAPAPS